jgi:hypothetical protein
MVLEGLKCSIETPHLDAKIGNSQWYAYKPASKGVSVGEVNAKIAHSAVMPEVIVRRDDEYLLVRGYEKGDSFWWSPGAYWVNAGTCNLRETDPATWIAETLMEQIKVDVEDVSLKGVSLVDADHAPVLIYSAKIVGDPHPNPALGFDKVSFFAASEFPEKIGRDEAHGRWLRQLVDDYGVAVLCNHCAV